MPYIFSLKIKVATLLGWPGIRKAPFMFQRLIPLFAIILFGLITRPGASLGQPESDYLPVILGEQKAIQLPKDQNYSVADPSIVSSFRNGDTLLVKGKAVGMTDLLTTSPELRRLRIHVFERTGDYKKWKPLFEVLSTLKEIRIDSVGSPGSSPLFVLRGKLSNTIEARKIIWIENNFPSFIENQIQIDTALYDETVKNIRLTTAKFSNKENERINFDIPEKPAFIEIRSSPKNLAENQKLQNLFQRICPICIYKPVLLNDSAPTIYFRVYLCEIKKSVGRRMGIEWPQGISGGLHSQPLIFRKLSELEATLRFLETEGEAKIISQPELAVRSPGQAELFSGGELPIETRTLYSAQLQWRTFGVGMKIKIHESNLKRVRLDLETEVSHIDSSLSQNNVPGIQASRLKTQVEAEFETPLFLSGLLETQQQTHSEGVPFLRKIPILSLFTENHTRTQTRSELVAILYPFARAPTTEVRR